MLKHILGFLPSKELILQSKNDTSETLLHNNREQRILIITNSNELYVYTDINMINYHYTQLSAVCTSIILQIVFEDRLKTVRVTKHY